MIESIKSFFDSRMKPETAEEEAPPPDHPPIHVAACALLLEVAYSDDELAPAELAQMEGVLRRHFRLDEQTISDLIDQANRARAGAVDLFQFTSLIAEGYSEAQKMVLLEAMWGVVFADGEVAKHETSMMRRVSKLLDVRPGFLAEARKRVQSRG